MILDLNWAFYCQSRSKAAPRRERGWALNGKATGVGEKSVWNVFSVNYSRVSAYTDAIYAFNSPEW